MQSDQSFEKYNSGLRPENGRITISNICDSDHSHDQSHSSQMGSDNKENQFPSKQFLGLFDTYDDGVSQASEMFNQQNYYFLFDKQMQFSKREGFDINKDLSPNDYIEMAKHNRKILCEFLQMFNENDNFKNLQQDGPNEGSPSSSSMSPMNQNQGLGYYSPMSMVQVQSQGFGDVMNNLASSNKLKVKQQISSSGSTHSRKMAAPFKKFPVIERTSFIDDNVKISDQEIDQNFKAILSLRKNGQFLSPEIVAHLEYFMNTLNFEYKSKTENPFGNPQRYPALLYRLMEDGISSEAIIESNREMSSSSSDADEKEAYGDKLSQNSQEDCLDDLIDDSEITSSQNIDQSNEANEDNQIQATTIPLKFGNFAQNANMSSQGKKMLSGMYPARRESIKEEIRRMSLVVLQNMSVVDRNSLFINPKNHMEKIRSNMLREKQHFFYAGGDNNGKSPACKSQSMTSNQIENNKLQAKIMRKSNRMMIKKDQWYPNDQIQPRLSSKWSGSPSPKKIGGIHAKASFHMTLNQVDLTNSSGYAISPAALSKGVTMFQHENKNEPGLIDMDIVDQSQYQKQQSQNFSAIKTMNKSRFGEDITQNGEISQFRIRQFGEVSDFDMFTDVDQNQINDAQNNENVYENIGGDQTFFSTQKNQPLKNSSLIQQEKTNPFTRVSYRAGAGDADMTCGYYSINGNTIEEGEDSDIGSC